MTPELGFALLVALLYGPTLAWLVYRAIRGPARRSTNGDGTGPGAALEAQAAQLDREVSVHPDGCWVCDSCRSLNRPRTTTCYRCRTKRGPSRSGTPVEAPPRDLVPVVAGELARAGEASPTPMVAVAAHVGSTAAAGTRSASEDTSAPPGQTGAAPEADRLGSAGATSLPRAENVEATVRPRRRPRLATAFADPAPESGGPPPVTSGTAGILDAAPATASGPPRESPVCPYIGFEADPSTRYDFPDASNRCHAVSLPATPTARWLRVGHRGGRRSRPVDPAFQSSHCLSATHEQCDLYRAATAGAGR
jgi:hypothetical protein